MLSVDWSLFVVIDILSSLRLCVSAVKFFFLSASSNMSLYPFTLAEQIVRTCSFLLV